jgi:hypothetical protein
MYPQGKKSPSEGGLERGVLCHPGLPGPGLPGLGAVGDVSLAGKSVGEVVAALGGMRGVYPMRGLWTTNPYTSLRNAAWLVRAARHGKENNPVALAVVIGECVRLVSVGEDLGDVVEALCELLVHP